MSDEQIKALIKPVLARLLEGFGFEGVDVRSDEDHDGDPALFVTIRIRLNDKTWSGAQVNAIQSEILGVLRGSRDTRFPYVNLIFGQEEGSRLQLETRLRDMLGA